MPQVATEEWPKQFNVRATPIRVWVLKLAIFTAAIWAGLWLVGIEPQTTVGIILLYFGVCLTELLATVHGIAVDLFALQQYVSVHQHEPSANQDKEPASLNEIFAKLHAMQPSPLMEKLYNAVAYVLFLVFFGALVFAYDYFFNSSAEISKLWSAFRH